MKTSGNKTMIIFSAVIVISMLMVPALPLDNILDNDPTRETEIKVNPTQSTDNLKDNGSVGFSFGREISVRL